VSSGSGAEPLVTRALRSSVSDRPVAAWIAGIIPNRMPVAIDAAAATISTRTSIAMV